MDDIVLDSVRVVVMLQETIFLKLRLSICNFSLTFQFFSHAVVIAQREKKFLNNFQTS